MHHCFSKSTVFIATSIGGRDMGLHQRVHQLIEISGPNWLSLVDRFNQYAHMFIEFKTMLYVMIYFKSSKQLP